MVVGTAGPALAQSVLADVRGLEPREVRMEAFALAAAQDVRVAAVGEEGNRDGRWSLSDIGWRSERKAPRPWIGNAWILDLRSRRTVWELSAASTSNASGRIREFDGTVRLPAGSYAAYVSAYPPIEYSDGDGLVNRVRRYFGTGNAGDYRIAVRGDGRRLSRQDADRIRHESTAQAFVAFRGSAPEQYMQAGFVLDRPTEVEIYALGEAQEDTEFDTGWIIDADTRERVWTLSWRQSTHAGGAEKNRAVRLTRRLSAGRYAAFYATDDSHDPSEWNSPPPHDPDSWGLTLRAAAPGDRAAIRTFDYEHVPRAAAFVSLTGVGDRASRTAGFTLKRALDVRIYALGEGRDNRMFDYGWITSGPSRTRVWDMRYSDTGAAGGDPKNRLVDRTIRLEPGNYVVHYVTDGSHSADEWNAAAPPDGRRWGITLLAASGALDRSVVADYDPEADPAIVAAITGVRDDDQVQKRFTLARETTVRIVALGEGTGRRLVDYGWIEDAETGRAVWEMTYRATTHAGGAAKNRRFDGTITLAAGQYVLRFETDGSHAFGGWNADPPDDPEAWGIAVYRR
jgi:hypothetical protein